METTTTEDVVIRRSPKYLAFMLAGIIVGIFVALVLTFAFPNFSEFTLIQIFGYVLVFTATIGGALGLVFALIFDRLWSKRTIVTTAERETFTDK